MNEAEYHIKLLEEESAEVAQRCSKAMRFGLLEVQPGQKLNNAQRIEEEFLDLIVVYRLMMQSDMVRWPEDEPGASERIVAKASRIEKSMELSRKEGCLKMVEGPISLKQNMRIEAAHHEIKKLEQKREDQKDAATVLCILVTALFVAILFCAPAIVTGIGASVLILIWAAVFSTIIVKSSKQIMATSESLYIWRNKVE